MAKYVLSDIFEGDFPVTQVYGNNPQYYSQFGLAGHEGIDFGTPNGTPILVPFDGQILRDVVNDKDYGNFVVVWDKKQLCGVWFCHLQDVLVKVGDNVTKGQVIGHTNNTGNTTGPHLHFNFVETDTLGNRLNMNNGYQGFLNALDPNLVQWQLGGQQVQVPTPPTTSPDPLQECLKQHDALVQLSNQKDATIDQLTKGNEDKQNQITSLNEQVTTLTKQVSDLSTSNTQLKGNVSAVQKQNSDLLQQLSDINKSDASAIDEGLKAEQALKDLNGELQRLATDMNVSYPPFINIVVAYQDLKQKHSQQINTNDQLLSRAEIFYNIIINTLFKKK